MITVCASAALAKLAFPHFDPMSDARARPKAYYGIGLTSRPLTDSSLSLAKSKPVTVPVLLPLALPAPYDYVVPEGMEVAPGQFVVVPLATVEYLGVVWPRDESAEAPKLDPKKLREIIEVVDDVPPLPRGSLDFADWVARYTLTSPGMVLRMMMSAGRAFSPPALHYGVRLDGAAPSRMTPARARVLEVAANGMTWVKSALAEAAGVSPGVIDGLVDAGTLITEELPAWAPPQLDLSTARARMAGCRRESGEARGWRSLGAVPALPRSRPHRRR